ncbi:phosphatase PAP2 family protein [Streptomyces sp. NBC_01456]|nr:MULTISPECIES: phosphatase PAP2 family protein [unclassified Streptomyces]
MRETPRSQGTAGDARPALPQLRPGRALAHNTGTPGTGNSGNPHRSDVRPPHTPRGARDTGHHGRLGTTPPVPRRPTSFLRLSGSQRSPRSQRAQRFPGSPGFPGPADPSGPGSRRLTPLSLCLFSALLFAALTWQVAGHGPLRALDERLGRAVASGGLPAGPAEFFADLGNTTVALPVLSAAVAWALWRGRREGRPRAPDGAAPPRWWLPALAAGLTAAAVPALVVPLKLWLARPGPARMAGAAHEGFYPSGHGATAAVLYGLAALLLFRGGRRTAAHRPAGPAVAAVLVLLNAGIGTGLVRRGYHWPLDVLGSWCLAGVLLALWCAVCDRWAGGRRAVGTPGRPAGLP